MGVFGSGYEQGSSWAVEVGGHMKICPIVVENLNMNGQMLIEVCLYIVSSILLFQELSNVVNRYMGCVLENPSHLPTLS